MATYNVGDIVRFHIPHEMMLDREGRIEEVLTDVDRGQDENTYQVIARTGGLIRRYTMRDRHVLRVIAQAPQAIPAPAPAEPIPQPAPEQDPADDLEAAMPGIDMMEFETEPLRPRAVRREIEGINWGAIDRAFFRTREDELKEEARANIAQYAWDGHNPVDFFVMNDRAVPIFFSGDFPGRIVADDYVAPTNRFRYFSYRTNGEVIMPYYNARNERIEFYSTTSGTVWVNQYQSVQLRTIPRELLSIDNMGVLWIRKTNLENGPQPVAPIPARKKKKLRRKYKEMPKIREEKHYAGKEFIA